MAEFCHPEFGCDCHEDVATELVLCDGCIDGKGYIWPIASNSNTDHDWVERCDSCERFESDVEAAHYLVRRLRVMGLTFTSGVAAISGIRSHQPFIDGVVS